MIRDFKELIGKKVVVLGYGLEGQAVVKYLLSKYPEIKLIVADSNKNAVVEKSENIEKLFLGESWLCSMENADIVIRSPGVSYLQINSSSFFNRVKTKITSITDIFLYRHAKKTIGITGTKGKSTTSSLVYAVLSSFGFNVNLIGNIGRPAIDLYDQDSDYFIYELSSYQLQDVTSSPHISIFLNIFPEHLDHHGNFDAYFNAKKKIAEYQNSDDICIYDSSLSINTTAQKITYDKSLFKIKDMSLVFENDEIFNLSKSNLKGYGNLRNVQAVCTLVSTLGLGLRDAVSAIYSYQPLPHRLEYVANIGNLSFVNDSISTVPQATLNALDAYKNEVRVLILGGYDRGVDYSDLVEEVLKQKISLIILFRPSGQRIFEKISFLSEKLKIPCPELIFVDSMEKAVSFAKEKADLNGVCLLSPASPSFGLFKNFEERGQCFKSCVLI